MSNRNRKPGRNSEWSRSASDSMEIILAVDEESKPGIREARRIALMDFIRFDATLQRVRSHPKNLLRLGNLRITQEREAKRNSGNNAAYSAATRRSMSRR